MLLQGKNAVIYGAGGSIGGAVARAFAREGATVHLAGRRAEPLERLAAEIRDRGGAATTATLDALDEHAVDDHAASLVASAGSLDISVISHGELFGAPLAEIALEDYERPIRTPPHTATHGNSSGSQERSPVPLGLRTVGRSITAYDGFVSDTC